MPELNKQIFFEEISKYDCSNCLFNYSIKDGIVTISQEILDEIKSQPLTVDVMKITGLELFDYIEQSEKSNIPEDKVEIVKFLISETDPEKFPKSRKSFLKNKRNNNGKRK